MTDELKPCPFCASEEMSPYSTDGDYGKPVFFFRCLNCGAESGWGITDTEARANWNRRATNPLAAPLDRLLLVGETVGTTGAGNGDFYRAWTAAVEAARAALAKERGEKK